jgi:hypothetical protein
VGWRNELRPERAAIVAIGDSQTYGDEVRCEDAWPQRLGRQLGRTTYNLALRGYGPMQYLRLVDDAIALAVSRYAAGGAEPPGSRENTKKSAKDPAPAR